MLRQRITFALFAMVLSQTLSARELKIWFDRPAYHWIESLPIGNGRLLATNQGGVHHEVVQLNEDTLWSGQPVIRDQPGAVKYFSEARRLLFAGKYADAQKLVNEKMLAPYVAHGEHTYQTLGDLHLFFRYYDQTALATSYRRELDLDRAISRVTYQMGQASYTRELFSSPVDQVIVVRLACDQPGSLSFDALFSRHRATVKPVSAQRLVVSGVATDKDNENSGGVAYETQIEFVANGGQLSALSNGIRVVDADTVELRIVAATDYHGKDPSSECERQLTEIQNRNYSSLREAHIREHQRLFRRVDLKLTHRKKVRGLKMAKVERMPTDQQLQAFRQGTEVPGLIELYFQFGRYLLISASRPGTQAINLWGKWVNTVDPAYNADYHTNINIPMNYWPAQICNLGECNKPFFDLIDELRPRGRISARETYGCRGFVAHHATNAWRFTAAVGRAPHGMWALTPAWGAHQMWKYYLYSEDKVYLEEKCYPVMKEAAEFFMDYLVEHPKTGFLVSGPSTSPENTFLAPNGEVASLSMGPTMDMQIIYDLLTNCIAAAEVLDRDELFRNRLSKLRDRLQPMQVNKDGRLLEWAEPFVENQPGHKHCSHFWGLCEGNLITPTKTRQLAQAVRKSLDYRVKHGSATTPVFRGNTAWILKSYVRLHDGEEAYRHLAYLIGDCSYPNLFATSVQGLRRKMWETDANFGSTAAIAEMLLQSHAGSIHLLPALPSRWPDGSVSGLRAEGGFEVNLAWSAGKLASASMKSINGNDCRVRLGEDLVEFETIAGQTYRLDADLKLK